MAEKKKDKSKKHQPRDADNTFGQNVQKSGLSTKRRNKKQYQKQDTFGHSENPSAEQKNLKSENTDADSKRKSDFSQENNTWKKKILNVISRRRTKPLRKGWNRSFMEAKN